MVPGIFPDNLTRHTNLITRSGVKEADILRLIIEKNVSKLLIYNLLYFMDLVTDHMDLTRVV